MSGFLQQQRKKNDLSGCQVSCCMVEVTYSYILHCVHEIFKVRTEMTEMIFKCPLCPKEVDNPNELREHRLRSHKSLFDEIKAGF